MNSKSIGLCASSGAQQESHLERASIVYIQCLSKAGGDGADLSYIEQTRAFKRCTLSQSEKRKHEG
jgi:hypothetical protein